MRPTKLIKREVFYQGKKPIKTVWKTDIGSYNTNELADILGISASLLRGRWLDYGNNPEKLFAEPEKREIDLKGTPKLFKPFKAGTLEEKYLSAAINKSIDAREPYREAWL